MNPLVSICVPTYNRAAFLRESLQTITRQDYAPLEILISDNCSDDVTEKVCREIARVDPRIRYVRHPCNIGLHGNHNYCIDASRGEFLCFFHDHDKRDLHIVSEYVSFLSQHPDVGVVCSDWELINDAGKRIGVRDHKVKPITPGLEYIDQTIRSGRSSIGIPGTMVRRSALGDVRFDEQAPVGFADFSIWFQMAETTAVGHISRRLWSWRQDPKSQSARTIESLTHDYYENLTHYCDAHLKRWPEHAKMVARWRSYIKRYLFWALAYEVGLYFRKGESLTSKHSSSRTLFEILNYRLTPEELQRVLKQLRAYRTGLVQYNAFALINILMRLKLTWPLAWVTQYHSSLRGLLGLR